MTSPLDKARRFLDLRALDKSRISQTEMLELIGMNKNDVPDLVYKLLEAVEVLKEIAGLELTAANVAKEFLRTLE